MALKRKAAQAARHSSQPTERQASHQVPKTYLSIESVESLESQTLSEAVRAAYPSLTDEEIEELLQQA